MEMPNFEEFRSTMMGRGFDEVIERVWKPNQIIEQHTHSFDADALVVAGEMWLTCGGATRHLKRGDTFQLEHGSPHEERYGADGATYWVARRNH